MTEPRSPEGPVRELVFYPSIFTDAALPNCATSSWSSRGGRVELGMSTTSARGVPAGALGRLMMMRVCTRALQSRSSSVQLASSLRELAAWIGVAPSGGERGSLTSLVHHLDRIRAAEFDLRIVNFGEPIEIQREPLVDLRSGFHPEDVRTPEGILHFDLSPWAYRVMTEGAVPLNMHTVRALRRHATDLDLYAWLARRQWLIQRRFVPAGQLTSWKVMEERLGCCYGRRLDFRRAIGSSLARVKDAYPGCGAFIDLDGITVHKGSTSVPAAGACSNRRDRAKRRSPSP